MREAFSRFDVGAPATANTGGSCRSSYCRRVGSFCLSLPVKESAMPQKWFVLLQYRDRTGRIPDAISIDRGQIATTDAKRLNPRRSALVPHKQIFPARVRSQEARITLGEEGTRGSGTGKHRRKSGTGTNRINCDVAGALIRHVEIRSFGIQNQRNRSRIGVGEWRVLNLRQRAGRANGKNRNGTR